MFASENNNQNVCRTHIYKRKHSQTTAGKGQAIKEFYQIRELAYHRYNRHHCHFALSIGLIELITKMGLYVVHERAWNKFTWGKTKN